MKIEMTPADIKAIGEAFAAFRQADRSGMLTTLLQEAPKLASVFASVVSPPWAPTEGSPTEGGDSSDSSQEGP